MGPSRSIERLRQAILETEGHAPSLRTLFEWSSLFRWQFRIAELERAAQIAEDTARLEAIREMAKRQADLGVYLQQRGLEWLEELDAASVDVNSALKLVVEGFRMERLARGEATARQEIRSELSGQFEAVSDEGLDFLIEWAERTVERAITPPPE
jgi:hypothetical protein